MAQAIDTRLSVNLNKVALLRNQRDVGYPSVLEAARLVVGAGAHGITAHPRPDDPKSPPPFTTPPQKNGRAQLEQPALRQI